MKNLEFTFTQLLAEARKRRSRYNMSRYQLEKMYEDMLLEKEMNSTPLSHFLDLCKVTFLTEANTGNFNRFGHNEKEENVRYELSDQAREMLTGLSLTGFASRVRETVLQNGHISSKQLSFIF